MNTYKINYADLRQRPEIAEMLLALERGFQKFEVDFYLVGAVARNVWITGINNKEPRRTTADVDFAVLIDNKVTYTQLREYLIENEGFKNYHENSFVLIWRDKTEVDLMPFGAIEEADGKVTIEGTGLTSINMPGFAEIYNEGLPLLDLEGNQSFKFCTLPGIVLLKFIAWHDRPEVRRNDITDICDILKHFFEMYEDEIYNNHNDLFTGNEIENISAIVLGREMRKIANRNIKIYDRIEKILNENTVEIAKSHIALIMTEYFDYSVTENIALLDSIKIGFTQ
jgi:predicted nucleotidyltransferase